MIHNSTNQHRRGHSMMEMMIVMSVLAGMAAVSWPMVQSPLSKMRLQAAAQEVSSELSKARLKAMQSGVAQVFRIQKSTGKFQITAATDDDEELDQQSEPVDAELAQSDSDQHSPLTESADLTSEKKALPDGICFSCPSQDEQSESSETEVAIDDDLWTDLAIFYPNGDTTNAVVGLRGERDFQVDVKLSGLTGTAKIGEAHRQELR